MALAVTPLDGVRAARVRTHEELLQVRAQKAALERELDQVAQEIERRKASASKILKSGDLDDLLRRSRELSGRHEELSRSELAAASRVQAAEAELVSGLDAAIATGRSRVQATNDRGELRRILGELRSLRAEREGLRKGVAGAVPHLTTGTGDALELVEQADAMRDAADKLNVQVQTISERIRDLRAERELDRHVREVAGEAALFEESDRRLRDVPPSDPLRSAGSVFSGAPSTTTMGAPNEKTSTDPRDTVTMGAGVPAPTTPPYPSASYDEATRDWQKQFGGASNLPSTTAPPSREAGPRSTEGLTPSAVPAGSGSAFPPSPAKGTSGQAMDENLSLEELERRQRELTRRAQDLLHRAAELDRAAKSAE